MRTPWGPSDSVETVATGIVFVSTPSHGGFRVQRSLLRRMPEAYQAYAEKWSGSREWYEEDCAYALVILSFPEYFTDRDEHHAHQTIGWLIRDGQNPELAEAYREQWGTREPHPNYVGPR